LFSQTASFILCNRNTNKMEFLTTEQPSRQVLQWILEYCIAKGISEISEVPPFDQLIDEEHDTRVAQYKQLFAMERFMLGVGTHGADTLRYLLGFRSSIPKHWDLGPDSNYQAILKEFIYQCLMTPLRDRNDPLTLSPEPDITSFKEYYDMFFGSREVADDGQDYTPIFQDIDQLNMRDEVDSIMKRLNRDKFVKKDDTKRMLQEWLDEHPPSQFHRRWRFFLRPLRRALGAPFLERIEQSLEKGEVILTPPAPVPFDEVIEGHRLSHGELLHLFQHLTEEEFYRIYTGEDPDVQRFLAQRRLANELVRKHQSASPSPTAPNSVPKVTTSHHAPENRTRATQRPKRKEPPTMREETHLTHSDSELRPSLSTVDKEPSTQQQQPGSQKIISKETRTPIASRSPPAVPRTTPPSEEPHAQDHNVSPVRQRQAKTLLKKLQQTSEPSSVNEPSTGTEPLREEQQQNAVLRERLRDRSLLTSEPQSPQKTTSTSAPPSTSRQRDTQPETASAPITIDINEFDSDDVNRIRTFHLKPISPMRKQASRKRVRWTAEEQNKLIELVGLYKPGDWKGILTHARSEGYFLTRTPVDLKDKWRNIQKSQAREERMFLEQSVEDTERTSKRRHVDTTEQETNHN
jgi:hypothetical protein